MNTSWLLVGIGGFIGSVLRYWLALLIGRQLTPPFPLGTFAVNMIGCLVIGIVAGLSERGSVLSPETRIFLTTGLCGGFTTFSTFSYESVSLIQDGELLFLGFNVVLSVVIGLASTYLGLLMTRSI